MSTPMTSPDADVYGRGVAPDAAALYEADAAAAAVAIAAVTADDGSTTSLDGGAMALMAMRTPLM